MGGEGDNFCCGVCLWNSLPQDVTIGISGSYGVRLNRTATLMSENQSMALMDGSLSLPLGGLCFPTGGREERHLLGWLVELIAANITSVLRRPGRV